MKAAALQVQAEEGEGEFRAKGEELHAMGIRELEGMEGGQGGEYRGK